MDIYKSIQETLSKSSINIPVGDIYDMIEVWKSWYRGNVNDFHYYNVQLADGTTTECEMLTMNMAKKISEDFQKLLWSEKVKISLDDDTKTKMLWSVLDNKKNNFSIMFPQFIEKVFALGTGATIEYKDEDQIMIDYIDADLIIPYSYQNGVVTGMIIIDQFKEGKMCYTHLTYHDYIDGTYTVRHELYKSKDSSTLGKLVSFEEKFPKVKNPYEVQTDTPHFQILKPNIVNNFDLNSAMGISVFANHIDKLKAIDKKYDSFTNEFDLGKKRILVDKTALKKSVVSDTEGNISNVSYFDRSDKAYQAINGMENQPVKEIDFSLRHQEHIESINAELNYLSAGVGLGQNYYSFDGVSMKTATEVISENSDTYRTKCNHQIMIKDLLYDLIVVICELQNIDFKEIRIEFDDSIIEDENTKREKAQIKVDKGLLSKKSYLIKYECYTEKEAEKELQRINEENKIIMPESVDLMNGEEEVEETEV
jgi:A118 family predicted phage portal protein